MVVPLPWRYYGLSSNLATSGSQAVSLYTNTEGMFRTDKEVQRSINGDRTGHLPGYAAAGRLPI